MEEITRADMPDTLRIFPLPGALLLPRGTLPLNIFEPHYINMIDDALRTDRLIGMIQPRKDKALYEIGCAGRITAFEQTDDGRYLINLTGVSRFRVETEIDELDGFRRIIPIWQDFETDLTPPQNINFSRENLRDLVCSYFQMHGMACDWHIFDEATDEKIITCLSMICPFEVSEKQALIEAASFCDRADMLTTMIDIALRKNDYSGEAH